MESSKEHAALIAKLGMIGEIFPIEAILNLPVTESYIQSYYRVNSIPYSLFHHFGNAVHMGISRNGTFAPEDLEEQARIISGLIQSHQARTVLELGGGRGVNSAYIGRNNPNTQCVMIDISETHLRKARHQTRGLSNVSVQAGSYQDLHEFAGESIDLVFAIETLCHSLDSDRMFREVARVLSPEGLFVVFDGYRSMDLAAMTLEQGTAVRLTEKGMAVSAFSEYERFCEQAQAHGLDIIEQENLSICVVPTMMRFERLAGHFFKHPRAARLARVLMPSKFVHNAISGFLMSNLMTSGALQYWMTVFRKSA